MLETRESFRTKERKSKKVGLCSVRWWSTKTFEAALSVEAIVVTEATEAKAFGSFTKKNHEILI